MACGILLGGAIFAGLPTGTAAGATPAAGQLAIISGIAGSCRAPVPGPASTSSFCGLGSVAVDRSGNVYTADWNNTAVEKIDSSGTLSVFAGRGGTTTPLTCTPAAPCNATTVKQFGPDTVAVDGSGNVYIGLYSRNVVEEVTPAGTLWTFAGTGTGGVPVAGPATSSPVSPAALAVAGTGDVYIATTNQFVLKVTPAGTLSVFAGTGTAGPPTAGPATGSDLHGPNGLAVDGSGDLYIADTTNHVVEKVTPTGTLSVVAGTGTAGPPTAGPATGSDLHSPDGVAVAGTGDLYIADNGNHVVEQVTPAGTLSVFAGNGTAGTPIAGPATSSDLTGPGTVAVDVAGDVYVTCTDQVLVEVGSASPATAPVFTADTPPAAVDGSPYTYTFAASGTPVPTFSLASGSLPPGLSLEATTGVLSGTPTGQGSFSIAATSSAGSVVAGPFILGTPSGDDSVVASTPDGKGYWLAGSDGAVDAVGDASSFGSMSGRSLNAPIVGIGPAPDGRGYRLAAADGGVFAFGSAGYYGSMAGHPLNAPVAGIAGTPDGRGYWLVAADGGVFAFGNATFYGSLAGVRLNGPIVGIAPTPDGRGYWLVAADGGVFAFGNATFYGSLAGVRLNGPIVGIAPTPDGRGYWLVAADGGVFCFGDAPFAGTASGAGKVAVGIVVTPLGRGYTVVGTTGAAIPLTN